MEEIIHLLDSPKYLIDQDLYFCLHKKSLNELDKIECNLKLEITELKELCINKG